MQSEPEAWGAHAPALAAWAGRTLVNRTDVWGYYLPAALRESGQTFGRTAPRKKLRGRVFLSDFELRRHFAGRDVAHLIGLHATSPDNTSRWGALDIDRHDGGTADPAKNLAAAMAWYCRLRRYGFRPLLTDSNGAGGYHLWVIFVRPVPTERVFMFLRWLVTDHAAHGLEAAPETFPKQARVEPGGYGNWLRLPDRHHTREHWSRVLAGYHWAAGEEAALHLLSLDGDDPGLIPSEVPAWQPPPPPPPPRPRGIVPVGDIARRIAGYLKKLPHRSAGQGRDDVAFRFACWLVRDMGLTDPATLSWLSAWDRGNSPPKGEARLREIICSARDYGRRPYGAGLAR